MKELRPWRRMMCRVASPYPVRPTRPEKPGWWKNSAMLCNYNWLDDVLWSCFCQCCCNFRPYVLVDRAESAQFLLPSSPPSPPPHENRRTSTPNMERDPNKRQIKPPVNPELIYFDDIFGGSSSDSDFRVEDHEDSVSDSDVSFETEDNPQDIADKNETENDRSDKKPAENTDQDDSDKVNIKEIIDQIRICSICLSNETDQVNELIDCDECGIVVHEGCYGLSSQNENVSENSSVSSFTTEPWFCESCIAGVENPTCELCPNLGGIFKETNYGKWVHLVCALYTHGIKFDEVNELRTVILFSNLPPRWGVKCCNLCEDERFAFTGVTIKCDAGMCKSNFHVTCAQREGGLSDATSPYTDKNDPFYGHCKLHVDKLVAKKRNRNWQVLQLRAKQTKLVLKQQSAEKSAFIERSKTNLKALRAKYWEVKKCYKPEPVPIIKISRPVTTSASVCRALRMKGGLMGVNMPSCESIENQITSLRDISKKIHVPPAFNLEFVAYFFDRFSRASDLKEQVTTLTNQKDAIYNDHAAVQENYNQVNKNIEQLKQNCSDNRHVLMAYYDVLKLANPNPALLEIESLLAEHQIGPKNPANSTSTFVDLNADIPIIANNTALSINNSCNICNGTDKQHLLVKCDTCLLHYHLGCISPPLARMPKKSKSCGWQCSECVDNHDKDDNKQTVDPDEPRKLRYLNKPAKSPYFLNNEFVQLDELIKTPRKKTDKCLKKNKPVKRLKDIKPKRKNKNTGDKTLKSESTIDTKDNLTKEQPRQGIKIFIKSVPTTSGGKTICSQLVESPPVHKKPQTTSISSVKSTAPLITSTAATDIKLIKICETCKISGTVSKMVQCDDCSKYYHFGCLFPPVNKTPKSHGYGWHCTECDPTDSDS